MGGLDLLDSFIDRSYIKLKSSKYDYRIFYHICDGVLISMWILHRRVTGEVMRQVDFRA